MNQALSERLCGACGWGWGMGVGMGGQGWLEAVQHSTKPHGKTVWGTGVGMDGKWLDEGSSAFTFQFPSKVLCLRLNIQ